MSPAFSVSRNVELSTIYYIETQIDANWSGVEVVKSFLSAYDKTLPVVCVGLSSTTTDRLEVGSTTLDNVYTFSIDIFATSDGQRIDLADAIMGYLKDGWVYYTHSKASGSTTLTRTSAGRCTVTGFLENSRVELGDVVENPDRFRHVISCNVRQG